MKPADLTDAVVSAIVLGKLLGLSDRRVRELRDQGVIPDDGAGRYRLGDAVPAYCAHMRPAAGKNAEGGSEGGAALDAARVRLVTAQAEARELLNAQLRGEAVMAEDLDAVVGATFDAVRGKVLTIPPSVAARVTGKTSKPEVQAEVAALVKDVLADLAETEVVAAVKDRARRRAGRGAIGDEAAEELSAE